VAVSFIGGGNRSTRRKPPTCRKSLTTLSHNIVHLTWAAFEPTASVVIGTDYKGRGAQSLLVIVVLGI